MRFEPGDLVLLAFPFTSETGAKQRPALVLLDTGDEDLLVARITGQYHATPFDVALSDWAAAGLMAPSSVRLHKMAAVEKRLVRRKLGHLQAPDWSQVRAALRQIFSQSEPAA
ncbi:MAG: type II toxin-antitoxin system PemK/MazF family toxin [Acidobacteriota bacterium]